MTLRTDDAKAALTVNNFNSNISDAGLRREWLHLNSQGSGKLAINIEKKIKILNGFDR